MNPITFKLRQVVCMRHGEPFREQWPKGYMLFLLEAFDKILGPDGDLARRDKVWAGKPDDSHAMDVTHIESAFTRKPMCCWLTRDELLELYIKSEIGKRKFCAVCRELRLGTPITTALRKYPHVCFECHLDRFMLLN